MSTIPTDIEIKGSNSKGIKIMIGLSIFVIAGMVLVISPELFIPTLPFEFIRDAWTIRVVGLIAVLFFGGGLVIIGRVFSRKKSIRLHINNQGITDQTSLSSVGLIDWRDLVAVEKTKLSGAQTGILLKVSNPTDYISKANNKVVKAALEHNMKTYGTPLVISATFLRISSSQLYALLKAELNKHRHFITE